MIICWDSSDPRRSRDDQGPAAQFLREDLKLELSPDKTLITHGRTPADLGFAMRMHIEVFTRAPSDHLQAA
jgi:hypothetical protein